MQSVEGDYLLAIGDSHVARWQAREMCGLPLINAGLHGATTADADATLARLALPRPPRAIILTVGTNDANRKRFLEPPQAVTRFRHAFRALLRRVSRQTDLVVVTSLPAMDARQAHAFSPEVAAEIATAAETSCRRHAACRVAEGFGTGIALRDGLHLVDYERAYASIAPQICGALAEEQASPRQNADAGTP
ncbi:hypothetical protein IP69_19530 [Bosea sp. AAP35]|nr:hypothetical protein IP69_19530 [Bosea sp. AAP35]